MQSLTRNTAGILALKCDPNSHFCPGCAEQVQNLFLKLAQNQISSASKHVKIITECSCIIPIKPESHRNVDMHGDYVDQTVFQDTKLYYLGANNYDKYYEFTIDLFFIHIPFRITITVLYHQE